MSLRDQLQSELAGALRSRDPLRTSVLRTALSAIANAEAVDVAAGTTATEVPRRVLTEDDVRGVVDAECAELRHAAAELRAHDRDADAAALEAKAAVLDEILRAQSSR
jgi:uncharacterized protein YqeY